MPAPTTFEEGLLARTLARPAQKAAEAAVDQVMHLAQSAEYQKAAKLAASLLEADCHDARAIVAYALAVFGERGPASAPSIFAAFAALLAELGSTGSMTPELRATDVAFRFCFRTLKAQLDFDEKLPAAKRQTWLDKLGNVDSARVLAACAELRQAIRTALPAAQCEPEFANVTARLESYFARLVKAPPAEVPAPRRSEPEIAPAREEPATATAKPVEVLPVAPPAPVFARRANDFEPDVPSIEVSPALRKFMRKLQIFELLLENGETAKAAIVAHDVRQIVASFDPMEYLPNLLSPHFRLLSGHADELSGYWEQTSAPSWQALEQLYRVDLDSFVEA